MAQQDFAVFFAAIWTDLAGFARTLTGDADSGDELAQEALVRIYPRYAVLREPRAYAFRVVTNLARDRWQRELRERTTWADLPREDTAPPPDRSVLDAVQRLRRPHQEVLLLHYWADLSVDDVARVLHRPVGTVKRRLSEARAALHAALEGTP